MKDSELRSLPHHNGSRIGRRQKGQKGQKERQKGKGDIHHYRRTKMRKVLFSGI